MIINHTVISKSILWLPMKTISDQSSIDTWWIVNVNVTVVFWTWPRCVIVLLCFSLATFIRWTADMITMANSVKRKSSCTDKRCLEPTRLLEEVRLQMRDWLWWLKKKSCQLTSVGYFSSSARHQTAFWLQLRASGEKTSTWPPKNSHVTWVIALDS